jgi:lipid II:glycine glycyltransferase (peptidoglycan interpeptide bridge formation enzyme)
MSGALIELKHDIDANLWDSKVKESRQGTLFNTSTWAEILKDTFGISNRYFCVFKNKNLIGGCNLYYKTKHGLKVATKIPIMNYNGLLFFNENDSKIQKESQFENEIIESIIKSIKTEFKFCSLSLHPTISDIRMFSWNNWNVLPQYTYVIPLNDEEQVWKNFSSSLRRKISRAEEQKFRIVEEDNIDGLVKLHEESYTRRNIKPVIDNDTLKKYCLNVKKNNLMRIFSIYGEDNTMYSSRAILVWNKMVYDWIAGAGKDNLNSNATHLLVWNILQKLIREGYKSFDFMGANTPGIIDFKKSFGGELHTTYDVTFYSSRFMSMLFKINSSFIKFRRGI